MAEIFKAIAITLTGALALASPAVAQTGASPAAPWNAKSAPPPAPAHPARAGRAQRKSASMDTSGPESGITPTGPNISTEDPSPNDLTGSTGASSLMPVAAPPPGIAPPNGAPDTSTPPNDAGGPHQG